MASVYLTCSGSPHLSFDRMRESAVLSARLHELVDDPSAADLILFAENYTADFLLSGVAASPLTRRFRSKIFCFCENDSVIARYPGIYASLPRRYCNPRWAMTGPYLWMMREAEKAAPKIDEPDLLFSFVGSEYTHKVRKEVMGLKHPRGYVEDTGSKAEYMRYQASESERQEFRVHYDSVQLRSKFVLCPRGMGCASIRLFETLRAGRVPVVISDDYVLPSGPNWESCSVRVGESEVATIPERLERLEDRASEMGAASALAHRDWYSPPQFFTCIVDQCMAIKQAGALSVWRSRFRTFDQLRQPANIGTLQRSIRQNIRTRFKGSRSA
jgi:hypothetical protein